MGFQKIYIHKYKYINIYMQKYYFSPLNYEFHFLFLNFFKKKIIIKRFKDILLIV